MGSPASHFIFWPLPGQVRWGWGWGVCPACRPQDPRSDFCAPASSFRRASSGALGPFPGVGDPAVVTRHPCPSLAGQRGGALSVPAVERFILELESLSLVLGAGEKFHSGASAVTRRPRADTRGRRFNVLQARDPRKGCGHRGGLGNQFSAT